MRVVSRAAIVAVMALVCGRAIVVAQTVAVAQISGSVRDESGGVLPGVDVTVTQIQTGYTRSVVTGADGQFNIPNLPVGPYRLQASLSRFR